MKKLMLSALLFIAFCSIALGQSITINGTVKSDQGYPVHYAFIKSDNNATYSDSTGHFTLTANPSSKITIKCNGYTDTQADATASLQVVLKTNPAAVINKTPPAKSDAGLLLAAFNNQHPGDDIKTGGGIGGLLVFTSAKETVGHRFLFTQWVHGYMVKANGEIVQTPTMLFNYDKIKGDLYITEDMNNVNLTDKNTIRSFVLFDAHDQPYSFERVLGISNDMYSQLISTGSKYKIYKLIATKFVASNYQSNGISSTGNTYDEFVDNNVYYVFHLKSGSFQQVALKKKALKEAFIDDSTKFTGFTSDHADDKIDESYLISLGNAMNE
ncbi:hypothetical protein SAMN05216490_4021 [Mucilaginibacter mallensis]|uniref:CarboxypepD_reg-like domain-containing protein n=1 Tax=Mucilaginibacter mallensis TaxID=652787 RepID=A0A1H2BBF7_MUCMA|nr:carboxypeptidase-like regulatory domain-containing protein [Mucilaginibacter mallensis]SDT55538.1 hypothetical protein SAMN05216490_4021 [Mucilaginibacter mallensis]